MSAPIRRIEPTYLSRFLGDVKNPSLSLIEVGCKPGRKRGQLLVRAQQAEELCAQSRLRQTKIYRTLVHIDPIGEAHGIFDCMEEHNPDAIIFYKHIPDGFFSWVRKSHTENLKSRLRNNTWKPYIDSMIDERNTEHLYELLTHEQTKDKTGSFRGRLVELLTMYDFYQTRDTETAFWPNRNISTVPGEILECDIVIGSRQRDAYWNQIERLGERDHLHVRLNWDISVPPRVQKYGRRAA